MTTVEIEYLVVDAETGESFTRRVYGTGHDKGDKGVYKGATGAEKYFFMKTFMIPTDDDPEREANSRPRPDHRKPLPPSNQKPAAAPAKPPAAIFITHDEQLEIVRKAKEQNIDIDIIKDVLKKTFGATGTAQVKKYQYAKVIEWIIVNGKPPPISSPA